MNEILDRRLQSLPGTARRALASRAALLAWRRALAGTQAPRDVARTVVTHLERWQPQLRWAVAVVNGPSGPHLTAHSGARLRGRAALSRLADRVLAAGDHQAVASLRTLAPGAPDAAAIGWAVRGRQDVVGVVLAWIDDDDSAAPAGDAGVEALLATARRVAAALEDEVFDAAGAALDVAVRVGRLEALAAIDDLTGLCNARHLRQVIERELHRLARSSRPVSLLFLDLDAFKRVNDDHGHLMGSRALVEFGVLLQSCTRATDTVARYGGDEFVVVLPDADRRQARKVARRIQERMAAALFLEACGLQVRLTVSVGVATLNQAGRTAADLLRMADEAMYWVKHHGRDGIRVASTSARAPRGSRKR